MQYPILYITSKLSIGKSLCPTTIEHCQDKLRKVLKREIIKNKKNPECCTFLLLKLLEEE